MHALSVCGGCWIKSQKLVSLIAVLSITAVRQLWPLSALRKSFPDVFPLLVAPTAYFRGTHYVWLNLESIISEAYLHYMHYA